MKEMIEEAKECIVKLQFMKSLARDEDTAIMINVHGIEIGVCDNDAFCIFIENEIAETQKAIDGKPNKWQ